ncbi:hypothetical protein KI387_000078 [Taxus chinensis]|uniref:Uncharacterized protein n=1 Tax=Taxus chinensis TaxID=29808 RepID=A0AA38GU84_TAXCH|nr:hypothetical protein KI387_000078 [Taxus chinensis]
MSRQNKVGKRKASPVPEPKDYAKFYSPSTNVFRKNVESLVNKNVEAGEEDELSPTVCMEIELKLVMNKAKFYKIERERLRLQYLKLSKINKELLNKLLDVSSKNMELELEVQEFELEIKNWETMCESNKKVFENQVASFNSVVKIHEGHKELWKNMDILDQGVD